MADDRDREIRQYLLGGLPGPAMQAIEEAYFADAALFERVEQAEHALIDEYLEGRLAGAERDQFEAYFLAAPARAKRVAIARALRETATNAVLRDQPQARRAPSRVWLALAASIVAAAALWFVFARSSPSPQQAGPAPQTQPSPPAPESPQPAPEPSFVALVLSPVATRSAEASPELRSTGATQVEIDLLGTARGAVGRVEIRSVDAGVVWTGDARPARDGDARGAMAHVTVPIDRLPPGDYILTLLPVAPSTDAVPLGTYYFRVSPSKGEP